MRKPVSIVVIVIALIIAMTGTSLGASKPFIGLVADPDLLTPISISPTEKLPAVFWQLADGEKLDVLVYLAEQVDTAGIAEQADAIKPAWISAKAHRNLVRKKVVDALQKAAERSQKPLLTILERSKKNGRVESFESFFVTNVVHVKAESAVLQELARLPEVARIIPNPTVQVSATIAEEAFDPYPLFTWNIEMADARGCWGSGAAGEGVVVGIIDTGVDWEHPALKQKWRGYVPSSPDNPDPVGNWYDVLNPTGNLLPEDVNGHGTHVAGIIVGEDPVTKMVYGMAPKAQWIAVNAFGPDGRADGSALLAAGQYMLAPLDADGTPRPEWAPDIINNSWGSEVLYGQPSEFFRPMVVNWRSAGILPVFAAGNDGPGTGTINEPGCYPESLAVGMLDRYYNLALKSSRGPGFYAGWAKPDLVAPGVDIISCKTGGGYVSLTGTSMAAPHVAGAAALVLSMHPTMSPYELEHAIKSNAYIMLYNDTGNRPNDYFGWGKVAANRAMSQYTWGYLTYIIFEPGYASVISGLNTNRNMTIADSIKGYWTVGVEMGALYDLGMPGITLANNLVYIDDYGLAGNLLTQVTLPNGLVHVGEGAFADNQLTEVVFPEAIEYIGPNAFAGNQTNPALLVIKGYDGTPAETYAVQNGHTFVNLRSFAIQLNRTPDNGGNVSGAGNYQAGTQVTVRATPASFFTFVHWQEGTTVVSEDEVYTFTAETDRTLTAVFTPVTYTVNVTCQPEGGGSFVGTGSYPRGAGVTLQANPASSYRFRHWEEGANKYTANPMTFTIYGDRSFTAVMRSQIAAQRISGSDRYETAVRICQDGWPAGAEHVVLVRGDVFADALAGVPLAHRLEAPILLTASSTLSPATKAEIVRLGANEITILGGNAAVSAAVENELVGMGMEVERIFGNSRYETAALIAYALQQAGGTIHTAVLAVGTSFPDALAVSSYAALAGMPILLTRSDVLPDATQTALTDLSIENVLVIGGLSAVSSEVYDQLPQGAQTTRIYGATRFETSVNLARYFGAGTESLALATGMNFPDAMAGGAWAAKRGYGILLTDGRQSAPHVTVESLLIEDNTEQVFLLGGPSALCPALEEWF